MSVTILVPVTQCHVVARSTGCQRPKSPQDIFFWGGGGKSRLPDPMLYPSSQQESRLFPSTRTHGETKGAWAGACPSPSPYSSTCFPPLLLLPSVSLCHCGAVSGCCIPSLSSRFQSQLHALGKNNNWKK